MERFFGEVDRFDRDHPRADTWRGLGALLLREVRPHLEGAALVYVVPRGVLQSALRAQEAASLSRLFC